MLDALEGPASISETGVQPVVLPSSVDIASAHTSEPDPLKKEAVAESLDTARRKVPRLVELAIAGNRAALGAIAEFASAYEKFVRSGAAL